MLSKFHRLTVFLCMDESDQHASCGRVFFFSSKLEEYLDTFGRDLKVFPSPCCSLKCADKIASSSGEFWHELHELHVQLFNKLHNKHICIYYHCQLTSWFSLSSEARQVMFVSTHNKHKSSLLSKLYTRENCLHELRTFPKLKIENLRFGKANRQTIHRFFKSYEFRPASSVGRA